MKCEEVREKLSEYLEEWLDRDSAGSIRDHLAACPRCREELRAITEIRRAVSDLPSADPPAGFARRVMARVREEADHPNLLHRLFLPVRLKIPIHALALLLVGGIAVYLYQAHQPVQPVATNSIPTAPEPTSEPEQDVTAPPQLKTKELFAPPPMERKLEEKRVDEIGRAERKAGKLEEAAGGIQATPPPAKAAVDYQLSLTARGAFKDANAMDSKLEALAEQMGGQYIRPGGNTGGTKRNILHQTETVYLVIPADRYDRFKTELAALGKIEAEIRAVPSSPDTGAAPAVRPPAGTPPFLRIQLTLRLAEKP